MTWTAIQEGGNTTNHRLNREKEKDTVLYGDFI